MSWPVPGVTGTTMVTVRPAGWAWPGDGQKNGPNAKASSRTRLAATRDGIETLRNDGQVYTYPRRLWHAGVREEFMRRNPSRRRFIAGLSQGTLALAMARPGLAQAGYPNRPIRIIVGFGAGGLADITMRLVADKLAERLGQRVIIDNRPGGGGVAAAQAVATSPPDGYTLIVLSIGNAISVGLFKSLPFDPVKDFVPVSSVAYFDLLLLVNANSPIRTVKDLL